MNGEDELRRGLESGGAEADGAFRADAAGSAVQGCTQPTWVDIRLLDAAGNPVPGARYRLELPDGRVIEGTLDENGLGGVDGIEPGECTLTFPDLEPGPQSLDP